MEKILSTAVLFFLISSLVFASEEFPKGYLVPGPDAIPKGFVSLTLAKDHVKDYNNADGYVRNYKFLDNSNMAFLKITETSNPSFYQSAVKDTGYAINHPHGVIIRHSEVKDINFKGRQGKLFKTVMDEIVDYQLYLDDNGKGIDIILRIYLRNSSTKIFTPEDVEGILDKFVQN